MKIRCSYMLVICSLFQVTPDDSDTPRLKRYDTYGSVWTRRRYSLDDDETFSFVQWMDSKALKLKEVEFL